jgi:hypothetical protein
MENGKKGAVKRLANRPGGAFSMAAAGAKTRGNDIHHKAGIPVYAGEAGFW